MAASFFHEKVRTLSKGEKKAREEGGPLKASSLPPSPCPLFMSFHKRFRPGVRPFLPSLWDLSPPGCPSHSHSPHFPLCEFKAPPLPATATRVSFSKDIHYTTTTRPIFRVGGAATTSNAGRRGEVGGAGGREKGKRNCLPASIHGFLVVLCV